MGEQPKVTVEMDSGPFTMSFGYVPIGVPTYSDVPPVLGPLSDEGAAELAGARMLMVGNWRSFTIVKRWWPTPSDRSEEHG